ncbi:ATP-binding protein [Paraburkholderia bonniea]|uniref:ATP-binding response regulator n=1 Tax=Paraburkholderia bonniea TaxID=2152891 RepID=UPI001FE7689A|nr:ATP-binding protein [Paraburkholderia bonniea]WJF91554.1 ATP-binding protein [Paraburkholderia bonniea]WJF94873.1 ATP-binding protein [Paraburkholderia bonniea]
MLNSAPPPMPGVTPGHRHRRPVLRRLLLVMVWLAALAAPLGAIGYLLYANLLEPETSDQLAAGDGGFVWDATQLQIAYVCLENQLLLYRSGIEPDYVKVMQRYEALQAKLRLMTSQAHLHVGRLMQVQRQKEDMRQLGMRLDSLAPALAALPEDITQADEMIASLHAHGREMDDMARSRRFVDVAERAALNDDFVAKRRLLFISGLGLALLLSAIAALLLVANSRRRTRLIRQQHAALEAEHQASRAARETNLAKDAFLGMISHELRTPLHAIVSSVELLGFNPHSAADRKVIQRLETAARQLEAQMKDLTDYARLGAGKLELRYEQFEPRALLLSIIDEHEPEARAKGLVLTSEAHGATGLVESDPNRIRQIVSNLVTNAIRYTETGSVQVRLVQQAAELSIAVSDTGPGVPVQQIPLVFKAFTQLDTSSSRRFEGAGMGLAIVRGLADLFGGEVEVESRVGEGSTFSVSLPVTPVAVPSAPPAQTSSAVQTPTQLHVLVVDDNQLVRESLCEMVLHMGGTAAAAASATAALAWLETQRCDLVLLDLHMPERDGYAFAAEFRARGGGLAGVPVIAVSAYAPDAPEAGAGDSAELFFDCLLKPVRYDVLRAAVERAMAAARNVT